MLPPIYIAAIIEEATIVETTAPATSITMAMHLWPNLCRAQVVPITSGTGDRDGAGLERTARRIVLPVFGHTARASALWTLRRHLTVVANSTRSWRECTVRTVCPLKIEVRRRSRSLNDCWLWDLHNTCYLCSFCLQRITRTAGSLKRTCLVFRLRPPPCKREWDFISSNFSLHPLASPVVGLVSEADI